MIKLIFLLLISVQVWGFNFSVSPTGFEVNLEKRVTNEVTVTNPNNYSMRIKVETEKPENCKEEEYLGEWVTIYPKIVTLAPFEEKVIRFSIRKPTVLKKGRYRTYLVFKEIPSKVQGEREKANIQILGEIAINVYGYI